MMKSLHRLPLWNRFWLIFLWFHPIQKIPRARKTKHQQTFPQRQLGIELTSLIQHYARPLPKKTTVRNLFNQINGRLRSPQVGPNHSFLSILAAVHRISATHLRLLPPRQTLSICLFHFYISRERREHQPRKIQRIKPRILSAGATWERQNVEKGFFSAPNPSPSTIMAVHCLPIQRRTIHQEPLLPRIPFISLLHFRFR